MTESFHKQAYTVALEPGVLLAFPARSRVGVELDLALVVPLTRPEFGVTRSGADQAAFRVSSVGFRVGLGMRLRF